MLYGFYKNGYLPEEGAILDQSNSLMQSFRILDATMAECEDQKREERSRVKGDPTLRG